MDPILVTHFNRLHIFNEELKPLVLRDINDCFPVRSCLWVAECLVDLGAGIKQVIGEEN